MHLLIVEDDRKVAGFLEEGFQEEGYRVSVARDGQDALDQARAEPFDVILLDFMLPRLSGPEVLRTLRGEGYRGAILMLTARDDPRDVRTALEAGADAYVTKPFRFADLLDRIDTLLAGRRLTA